MIAKTFEVRDKGTFIPVLAIPLNPAVEADRYLLGRSGYGTTSDVQGRYILLMRLAGGEGEYHCDPSEWGPSARTMPVAHRAIIDCWDHLESGQVIDVEYVLSETQQPKQTEAADPWCTAPPS